MTSPDLQSEVRDAPAKAIRQPGSRAAFAAALVLVAGAAAGMFMPLVPEAIGFCAIVLMLTLIFLKVPVGIAMIVPSLCGLYAMRGSAVVERAFSSTAYSEVASWTLSVVPMFILMGLLMWKSGLTDSLFGAARLWLGKLPGGLAVSTNLAGAGLASVSGSTLGVTYALARIGIPEMLKAGYDKRLAIGAVIVAGLPGQLIPPSIMLVIYAGIVQVPVGPQLLAGVVPGVLVAVIFSFALVGSAHLWDRARDSSTEVVEPEVRVTWGDRLGAALKTWPFPLVLAVILGGIYSGVFTATEAGAFAVLLTLVVTVIWKWGDRPIRAMREAALATVSSIGAIFLMLIGVKMLSSMLALSGISDGFASWIQGMELGRIEFLLLMMVVYIVLGTFMEPLLMMMLTIPILLPTIQHLDISLLWFGVFVVFMAELAILTPPLGILSFVIHSITKDPEVNRGQTISLNDVYKAVWWFMPVAVLVIVILILFPQIVTTLPDRGG